MTGSVRLKGPERRAQLLGVGRQVFAERGFHETTMAEIATAAGVTKPVLYQHFESKRDLFRALLEDVGDRLQAAVFEAATGAESPREQVEAGLRSFVEFVVANPNGFQMLVASGASQDSEWQVVAQRWERSMSDGIADLIVVDGMPEAHRRALANGVVGLGRGMMMSWLTDDESDLDADDLAHDLATLAWSGLRGLAPPTT